MNFTGEEKSNIETLFFLGQNIIDNAAYLTGEEYKECSEALRTLKKKINFDSCHLTLVGDE